MIDKERMKQVYMQSPNNMSEEYKFNFDLWCKYYRKAELYDRTISPNGMPRNGHELMLINVNATRLRKELGLHIVSSERELREHALDTVDREFLDGTNAN